ncbi:MAG: hypothetical protein V1930_00425 [Pseudomonadota bacterium]
MLREEFEKQFGIIAITKGFITPDELIEALRIQLRDYLEGKKPRLIGKILYDEKFMTIQQVDDVLKSKDES